MRADSWTVRCLAIAVALGMAAGLPAGEAPRAKPPSLVHSAWPGTVNTLPRPVSHAKDVPLHTTLYFELAAGADGEGRPDPLDVDTLRVTLAEAGASPVVLLDAGRKWLGGASGRIFAPAVFPPAPNLGVYVVLPAPLKPATSYAVGVECKSRLGAGLAPDWIGWKFRTRAAQPPGRARLAGDVARTVRWQGQIFAGICKPNFDTSRVFDQLDSYDLMAAAKGPGPGPAVCSLQRDWPLCSDGWMGGLFDGNPNLVRERETRVIVAMADEPGATVLTLDDLPEGPLYGIEPKRPLSADYHAGDEVLIADTARSERGIVLSADDAARRVRVKPLARKASEWKVTPKLHFPKDNPATPDNFPHPGAYLRKFRPSGTPVYYWKRMEHEWDLVHRRYGRRLIVNFEATPCDLALDGVPGEGGGGGSPGPAKDWPQWHEFVRRVTAHLLKRYGNACYDFYWSIGNECDLRPMFWRADDEQLLKWYDYTADAVCRAFEDQGMDSSRARVGGIELGAIAPEPPLLRTALEHCSPREGRLGALEKNFAFADPALVGKRSKRVERLCAANGGRGSPCDWISLHQYKLSAAAVTQLTWARRTALAVDPDYYDRLFVNSNESCPDWSPGRDPGAHAMYHGNGYFVAWSADWSAKHVALAVADPRFARHETVLTVWPFDYDLAGMDSLTALLHADVDGDGKPDRVETVRKDVLNYLECVGRMPREYFALGEVPSGPVVLGGFGARDATAVYLVLYGHDPGDVEGRGEGSLDAAVRLDSFPFDAVEVESFPIDAANNSFYREAVALLAKGPRTAFTLAEVARLREAAALGAVGPTVRVAAEKAAGGGRTLDLPVRLPANGVVFLVLLRT